MSNNSISSPPRAQGGLGLKMFDQDREAELNERKRQRDEPRLLGCKFAKFEMQSNTQLKDKIFGVRAFCIHRRALLSPARRRRRGDEKNSSATLPWPGVNFGVIASAQTLAMKVTRKEVLRDK